MLGLRGVGAALVCALLAIAMVAPGGAAGVAPDGAAAVAAKAKPKAKTKRVCKTKRVKGKKRRVCRTVKVKAKAKKKAPPAATQPSGGGGQGTGSPSPSPSQQPAPQPQPQPQPQQDPKARFAAMMEDLALYAISASHSSTSSSSREDRYWLCRGRYRYRQDSSANNSYQKGWEGTYEVVEAAFDDSRGVAQGRVRTTVDQGSFYAYVNGANDDSEQAPTGGESIVTFHGDKVYVGEQEFSRQGSGCGP